MRTRYPMAAAIGVCVALVSLAGPAFAQKADVRYDPIGKTVNLDADNAPIRQIVQKLLSAASITRYRMDPRIDAPVTLSLRNTPFERALQTVLARAGAEHDYADGVLRIYRVGHRPGESNGEAGGGGGWRPGGALPEAFMRRVALRLNDAPISTVMANLSRVSGVRITATRETPLDLRVTVIASSDPLWSVLQRIAQASRLKVEVTGEQEATFSPLTAASARDRNGFVGSSREGGPCRHCHYALKSEWKYCPMCGERIER